MLLPVSLAFAAAATEPDFANGDSCAQRIRLIDDQADQDVREVNQEIARLRLELAATSATNASGKATIQTELAAAQVRRTDTLRDHHSVLNDVRAQCDIQRAATRQANRNASSPAIDH